MITAFGKALRTIRIEHDEILKDMADRLGVSTSFLSAVEIGKKNIPANWVPRIAELYNLSREEETSLESKANDSVTAIKLNLYGSGKNQRNMALVLARSFQDISEETAAKILEFMSDKDKEE